jgi:hypothetical protein
MGIEGLKNELQETASANQGRAFPEYIRARFSQPAEKPLTLSIEPTLSEDANDSEYD